MIEKKIIDLLNSNDGKLPKGYTWYSLGKELGVEMPNPSRADEPGYEYNSIQKKTQDIWRKYVKQKNRLELTKETYHKGELVSEVFKATPEEEFFDESLFTLDRLTTNPHGGVWKKFKKIIPGPDPRKAIEKLFSKYSDYSLEIQYPNQLEKGNTIGILNLYDAHIDKIPIKSVTGVESSLEENISVFKQTIERILPTIIESKFEKLILPIGNDLFHTNGFDSRTKKGTQLDYYESPEEAYYSICDLITETIIRLSTFVEVEVIMVKGNHDEDKITTMGYWLERMFRNNPRVNVEATRRQRKYFRFGENLIGFAHGDKEKSKISQLPLIMATESKEDWGKTTYRKMYLGDLHHGFEYQFMKAKDQPGVEVEYLRSVGTTDSWHEDFGWIGVPKTAYLQVFDYEEGETVRMKFNIK